MSNNWKTATNPGFRDPADPLSGFTEHPAVLDSIPGFILPDLSRIPSTSETSVSFSTGFSGVVNGVADEVHTPAGLTQ